MMESAGCGGPIWASVLALRHGAAQIDVARQRWYFWDAIGKKLDKLGKRITPKDRKKIEAAIALKVPRRARRKKSHAAR